uniref:BTB domain-containing protein n=1 Tax=Panagrellus redivivus TaxID=6233 RepID=A0A7E4VTF7_PANRE
MMAEICEHRPQEVFEVPSSSGEPESPTLPLNAPERPFKLLVKNEVFTIDSEKLRKLSPIFAIMCYGRDFENGRELAREIVDEKSHDIATFLNCLHNNSDIDVSNFGTILRLATKYQVDSLVESCENYILETADLNTLKPDQVLTLIIASNDYHLRRAVLAHLVLRLAQEDRLTFNRLKLSRFLPAYIYGGIIATNMNLSQAREISQMNGHSFRLERCTKILSRRSLCDKCKKIVESSVCEGCKLTLCKNHWSTEACTSDYGTRMLRELKANIVELDYD